MQATWIRNTIVRALRDPFPEVVKRLSVNFVYQAPSVVTLTQYLSDLLDSVRGRASKAQSLDKVDKLRDLVEKYTANFPPRPSTLREATEGGDVVFVTGTTGGLGSDILAHLLHDASVVRVYAFNRPSGDVAERQRLTFRERGLNEDDLNSVKFVPLEGDLSQPEFGIAPERYAEVCISLPRTRLFLMFSFSQIRDSVTHIIHNGKKNMNEYRARPLTDLLFTAWRVDFNLSVVSFEKNIQGTRNLVNLALTSPHEVTPRLLFVSSIGVFQSEYNIS